MKIVSELGNIGYRKLVGRRVLYTDATSIDATNICSVLTDVMTDMTINFGDIDYLYKYYKGDQPILYKTKDVRPEICNTVVQNRANEIVSFKTGYLMGEPVQYVSRNGGSEQDSADIKILNDYMFSESKANKDKKLAEWFYICGVGYRLILPDAYANEEMDEAPFELYTLDPRNTFVVRYRGVGHKVVMAGTRVITKDNRTIYSIYTKDGYYEIEGTSKILSYKPHMLNRIPIIEYKANTARLGAFEIVITLLDAINTTQSNRVDGVEQFIQALLMFKGVDIESEDYKALKDEGAICVPVDGDIKYLIQELSQSETQTLMDDMYDTVLTICGMPNRNGGSSTSDTGAAVIMRDGWSAAESRAKSTEMEFKESEIEFLKLTLYIINTIKQMNIRLSSIDVRFTRRNYENILQKSQVLTTMLNNAKIHPQLAFSSCGMFADPENAYLMSKKYAEEHKPEPNEEIEVIKDETEPGSNNGD